MTRRRVGRHVGGGDEPEDEREARERRETLTEGFSRWASGVTIVAVREGSRVHALTVSAFLPVSVDPPLVLVSLGGNAAARPYLEVDTPFAISILGADQRGLASRYADTFPVGPSPFPTDGPPVVAGALAVFDCEVEQVIEGGDHALVLARVIDTKSDGDADPLIYFRRAYHSTD